MRFVIIGTSGSGKTAFANSLAKAIGCPHIELDQLYWGPNWKAVPPENFETAVRAAITGDSWVADGNYSAVRYVLWSRATHIIWLNFSRFTVFSRVFWRTVLRGVMRTELFNNNRESLRMAFFSKESVLLWSLTTFSKNRTKFSLLRQDPKFAHLQWTEITKPSHTSAIIQSFSRVDT